MYNMHQYIQSKKRLDQEQVYQSKYANFMLKNQWIKEEAAKKQNQKIQSFIHNQHEQPFIFQDDHFQRWRVHRQYRNSQNSTHFFGFKTFRHRPNEDMDKFYNQRERKQIQYLSETKKALIKKGLIEQIKPELLSRSMRSQGPLNPKIQFRQTPNDNTCLQPKLRFSNITDSQRRNQSAMSFDQRVSKVYQSFVGNRSKIGRISIKSSRARYSSRRSQSRDGDNCSTAQRQQRSPQKDKFGKEVQSQYCESVAHIDDIQKQSQKMKVYPDSRQKLQSSQEKKNNSKSKTYFKLAKTMQLFQKDNRKKQQLQQLMKNSQFERKKYLTNIKHNMHGQNFQKSPIL